MHIIVRMHHVVLNELIAIMCNSRHSDVMREAFHNIMHVVDVVASATATGDDAMTQRNALLDSFVHHFFTLPTKARTMSGARKRACNQCLLFAGHTLHSTLARQIHFCSTNDVRVMGFFHSFDFLAAGIFARSIGVVRLVSL